MNYIEFLHNKDKYLGENHDVFLQHYGILGQKWGTRRWQNADGTFNEEGKQRYFGKAEKLGSAKSEAKDYLKFRNKMLKERTTPELNQWYREQHKKDDKQFVKNAKRVDKSREKMYKDQLKDFYDDPNELVNDLKNVYRISGNKKTAGDMRIAGLFGKKTPEEKEAKRLAKEAKELEKEFTTTSKYDSSYKYLDGEKIDKWLDKEENKAVEKAYADAMNTAFGDTSKELHELFKDYDDNRDKYIAKAGIYNGLMDSDKLGDISSIANWYLTDDGNQGSGNSYAYYMNEKGYDSNKINAKLAEAEAAMNEGYEVGKKLSQWYNPIIPHMSEDLQKKVYNRINFRYKKQDDYVFNKLLNASESYDLDKDTMKVANDISKKLSPSCSNQKEYGWYYFNNAVRNLGMTDMNYKDLSQADWDKINAEINRLK